MSVNKLDFKSILKFLVINILFALPHAFITLVIDTGIMKGTTQTENAYMSAVLVVWLVYTWFYSYVKAFIKYRITKQKEIPDIVDKIANWVYVIVSMAGLFVLNRIRNLGDVGDAIAITVAIFDIFFIVFKTKWIRESYFFENLLFQEKFTNAQLLKEERKRQFNAVKLGLIFGTGSVLILILTRFVIFNFVTNKIDGEMGLFASIIAIAVLHGFYVEFFNKVNLSKLLKDRDVNVKYYYNRIDIAENAFKFSTVLSYFIVLMLMKFNIILSIFVLLGIKWLSQYKLWGGSDPDYTPSGNYETTSYSSNKEEKKPEFTIKTGYVKDQFGNIVGKTETYGYSDKYGGFETTEYKDNLGNVKGKSNTYKF